MKTFSTQKSMALEIERRFLVAGEEWKISASNSQHLRQGYLASSKEGWTVRVRILREQTAWLTLKAPAGGISRHEFEYLIPLADAESLWERAPYKLSKTRYPLNINGNDWVIDCFKARNYPLIIAEIELTSPEQHFERPTWCYQEITSSQKLSNAALAQTPISEWSPKALQAIQNQANENNRPTDL